VTADRHSCSDTDQSPLQPAYGAWTLSRVSPACRTSLGIRSASPLAKRSSSDPSHTDVAWKPAAAMRLIRSSSGRAYPNHEKMPSSSIFSVHSALTKTLPWCDPSWDQEHRRLRFLGSTLESYTDLPTSSIVMEFLDIGAHF
jgi:hypothetical protein